MSAITLVTSNGKLHRVSGLRNLDTSDSAPCESREILRKLDAELGATGLSLATGAPLVRIPHKTHLSSVLLNNNPWEKRDLDKKLGSIKRERERKEKSLDWNQRHFFTKQIFGQDYKLRFAASGSPKNESFVQPSESEPSLPQINLTGRGIFSKPTGTYLTTLKQQRGPIYEPKAQDEISTARSKQWTHLECKGKASVLSESRKPSIKTDPEETLSLPRLSPDVSCKVAPSSESICDEKIVARITQTLPVSLMIRANQNVNKMYGARKRRMLVDCRRRCGANMVDDPRFTALANVLVRDDNDS